MNSMEVNVLSATNSPYLYASEQAAHDDMMLLAAEVIREIRADGGKPPAVSVMSRDLDKLWDVWKLFAPRGHHGSETGTRLDDR